MGIKSWSRTAANNVLANIGYTWDENQAPSTVNDSARQTLADVAREWLKGTDVASATATDITADTTTSGGYYHITGTTPITSFSAATAGIRRRLVFDAALVLTHNATNLILLGGVSITTAAGDTAEFVSEGSGNWRMTNFNRASGNVESTGTLGYVVGAGGAVTQGTDKSTTVVLNKATGLITMHAASMAAAATVAFSVTNSTCASTDSVILNHQATGNPYDYQMWVRPGVGTFVVYVKNISSGPLAEAVVISFSIVKGINS